MNKETYLIIDRQNAGRSQMGEGFLKQEMHNDPNVIVISAGLDTTGMKEKYDNHPNPKVISVMQEKGVDISHQEITQVTHELLENSSQIIVLTEKKELPEYFCKFTDKTQVIPVKDPAPGNADVTDIQLLRNVRDQIRHIMSQVAQKI